MFDKHLRDLMFGPEGANPKLDSHGLHKLRGDNDDGHGDEGIPAGGHFALDQR